MSPMTADASLLPQVPTVSSQQPFISNLPTEILAYIFELGRPNAKSWKVPTYPIIISSTCGLWRAIATNTTPRLWNSVIISPDHSLDLTLLFLERSKDVLLNVLFLADFRYQDSSAPKATFSQSGMFGRLNNVLPFLTPRAHTRNNHKAALHDALQLLIQSAGRWEKLELVGQDGLYFSAVVEELREISAPNLRSFGMWASIPDLPGIFEGHAPKLSFFAAGNVTRVAIQPASATITTLELTKSGWSMDSEEYADFLNSFQNLRQLSVISSGPQYGGNPIFLPKLVALMSTGGGIGLSRSNDIVHHIRSPELQVLKTSGWSGETGNSIPGWAPPATLITSSSHPFGFDPRSYASVKHLIVCSVSSNIINAVSEILRGDHQDCFGSLQTLTVVPRSPDEYRLGAALIEEDAKWPKLQLESIRLVTDPRKSTDLEEWLGRAGVRLEKLSRSVNYSEISSYIHV